MLARIVELIWHIELNLCLKTYGDDDYGEPAASHPHPDFMQPSLIRYTRGDYSSGSVLGSRQAEAGQTDEHNKSLAT